MTNPHLENLVKLRESMVEYRRAVAGKVNDGAFIQAADNVVEMQEKIEAIDRAIADETKFGKTPYLNNIVGTQGS
ncbi:MAG: hypothetical protein K0M55_15875 [Rhizobium sp.]|nr:hypothetical protein [Rhizobium sp.]MBW8319276.1 hypothetical protein [Rhizobium sp.]